MSSTTPEEQARDLLRRGLRHERARRTGRALQAYRRALRLHPSSTAYLHMARALSRLQRHEAAIDFCRAAIAHDPDEGAPYCELAINLVSLARMSEAEAWLELALSAPRNQQRARTLLWHGRLLERRGFFFAALDAYRGALAERPRMAAAQRALTRLLSRCN